MADSAEGRPVVVAGVDGSPESVAALRWASRYAAMAGATVRAVLAWHYPAPADPASAAAVPQPASREVEQRMRKELAEAIAQACPDPASAPAETRVTYGHPAQVLIDESKDADLLVVGSRGRGAFTSMLVGSVSIHCVTHAFCPVVVVRGTDQD